MERANRAMGPPPPKPEVVKPALRKDIVRVKAKLKAQNLTVAQRTPHDQGRASHASSSMPVRESWTGEFELIASIETDAEAGTIVAKAPADGSWQPHCKMLFVRAGVVVFDIGWVGELVGSTNVSDGLVHTVE